MLKNIFIKVGLAFVVIGVILSGITLVKANFDFEEAFCANHYEMYTKDFEASELSNIEVNVSNVKVDIVSTTSNNITVTYFENNNYKYVMTSENNTLLIDYLNNISFDKSLFNFCFKRIYLKVELPSTYTGSIKVNNHNSKVSLTGFNNLNEVNIKTSNASIVTNLVSSSTLNLTTSNGEIEVNSVSSTTSNLTTSNKDIEVNNSTFSDELNCRSSNAEIVIKNTSASNKMYLKTSNDDIEFLNIISNYIECINSNGSIEGNIVGSITDYVIESYTTNGNNNLVQSNNGSKVLKVTTSNNDIKVVFTNYN